MERPAQGPGAGRGDRGSTWNPCLAGLLAVGTLVLVAGCAGGGARSAREPVVKPGLILVTPDQAERHGLVLSTEQAAPPPGAAGLDSAAVLRPGGVKVYSVGRYQDPADPDLLHEAHLVYRRESAPDWVLEPGKAGEVLVGPTIAERHPGSEALRDKELEAVIASLRRQVQEDRAALEQITRLLEQLNARGDKAGK